MESLFTHLGINWKLLIAQGVNFFALVILLNYLLYKPLVRLINDRRRKIEEGLKNAKDAEVRLSEIDDLRKEEVRKGERTALEIIELANKEGRASREIARKEAEVEAKLMKKKTEDLGRRLIQREMDNLEKNSREIVKKAIFASVGINPGKIDEKLVDDAVTAIKKLRV